MSPRRARANSALDATLASAGDAEPADDVERSADRLHSAAIHLLRKLRREDTKTGLSAPRLSALSVVVFGGPLTLGDLAKAEQVRPPTMTRLVSGLEDDGLVTREPDVDDGRLTRIHATPKGRSLMMKGRARRVATLTAELRALPRQDREAVERAVGILQDVIGRLR